MSSTPLTRSMLALAITTASLAAHAETYQIDNGAKTWSNQTIADGLSISGALSTTQNALTLTGNTSVRGDVNLGADVTTNAGSPTAVTLDNTQLDGGITHSGALKVNATDAITGGSNTPAGLGLNSVTAGNGLKNSGSIEVSSLDQADGIRIGASTLAGALDNDGSISVSGDYIHGIAAYAGSQFNGLNNTGTITAQGITAPGDASNLSEAEGITVDTSIVNGDLNNSGDVTVSAYEASGIAVHAYEGHSDLARISGDLLNSGTIDVTAVGGQGGTAAGIVLYQAEIDGELNNSGTISAKGEDSAGLYVDGGRIGGGIVNSGTIRGDRVGIYLSEFTSDRGDPLDPNYDIVHKNGVIEGGEYSIYANPGDSTLRVDLAGGAVNGNISGIGYIAVTGDTIFDGTRIENGQFAGEQTSVVDLFNADDSPLGKAGRLTLVQPHVTIDGALEMNRGTELQLNLSDATDPNRAILTVRDDAYFSPTSSIALRPTSEAFRAAGKEYKLIKAGVLEYEGAGPQVLSSSPLLTVDSSRLTDTEVLATVSTVSGEQAGEIIDQAGSSSNASNAFEPFYADVMGQLDDNDGVFQRFANADEAQLAALSEQLSPQVDGALQSAARATQNLVNGAVTSRTSALRGASSGSAFSESGFWVQGHDSDLRQGRRSGIAGYDADSRGLSLGIDGKLNEQWTLGAAYSNLDTNVSGRNGNKSEIDTQVLTLYSGFEQGPIFVDTSLSYGFNDNTSKRNVAGTRAKGDFDSTSLALNLEAGYGLHANGITLEPRVAARYSRLDIDSYREKGSPAALAVSSQRYEAIELGAGARLASQFSVGQGTLEPELKLMAYHDFAADRASSTSSFLLGGSSFVTHGASPARDSYEASLGVNYRVGALSLGAGYEHVGRSGFDADTLRAKVRYDF